MLDSSQLPDVASMTNDFPIVRTSRGILHDETPPGRCASAGQPTEDLYKTANVGLYLPKSGATWIFVALRAVEKGEI